ncbi:MAG: hypothetical protein M1823_005712 [Watsoniomyces obsoletus]|nr:MAG: hypothetical protein M1823_005712 [Watsoniomyces obsoletus]
MRYHKEKARLARAAAQHPYLGGNFAPVTRVYPLTPCEWEGHIPDEFIGGQYVRNGGNPVTNDDLARDAHWFDGDGMLTGVSFRRIPGNNDDGPNRVQPEFVNQYVLTDLFLAAITTPSLRRPILPSIATLINPLCSLLMVVGQIFRTVLHVFLSRLWGAQQAIERISVANTAIVYHDGRALATCESGPPMRVTLPELGTVGWFDGVHAEGEPEPAIGQSGFAVNGLFGSMKEYTTAHPRVDPVSLELMLFHSSFVPPYVLYSIIPSDDPRSDRMGLHPLFSIPVPGVTLPKMMHDFGVSTRYTVILDLPLSLDPLNLARNKAFVSYDPKGPTRFGVFPRRFPEGVEWFETSACCIFHTANTWDEVLDWTPQGTPREFAVNMLVCRLTSAALMFTAGNVAMLPGPVESSSSAVDFDFEEEDQCRLYYYRFDMPNRCISHQWALSAIPFEFSSVRDDRAMSNARYVYGCASGSSFGAALGRAAKLDSLLKVDALTLIERGRKNPPASVTGCVDTRTAAEVLHSSDPNDPIQLFAMPSGWYAQEPRFVPRAKGTREDDGWLVFYVFDESQLEADGHAPEDAYSELWILDAKNMRDVVARIFLPQRVPYGFHGGWFREDQIQRQRPVLTTRSVPEAGTYQGPRNVLLRGLFSAWMPLRETMMWWLA